MTEPGLERFIVAPLVLTLSRTTNSYKFLFFKAILDTLNITGRMLTDRNPVPLWEIYAHMFVNAWYPVSQFRLSLGSADPIPQYVHRWVEKLGGPAMQEKDVVPLFQPDSREPDLLALAAQLDKYVKYRFVRPWLEDALKGVPDQLVNARIATLLAEDVSGAKVCPYHFTTDAEGVEQMTIAPHFVDYLRRNGPIIYDWWRWKFANYLAARNPYSPNILAKLEPPGERDLNLARSFWRYVIANAGVAINCIYTGEQVESNFSLDHFIPWSFVLHDRLWNLVPTSPRVNSSKSAGLPSLDIFAERFVNLQMHALNVIQNKRTEFPARITEHWIAGEYIITDSQPSLLSLAAQDSEVQSRELLSTTLKSLWLNARNQGFPVWARSAS